MLNLLVSILGDSYERIQVNLIESDYSQMLDVIIELENLMIWKRSKGSPVYMQECKEVEDDEGGEEWEGRIRALQDKITKVQKTIENKFQILEISHSTGLKFIEEKLQENDEKLKRVEDVIEEKFKSLEEKLNRLLPN